MNARARQCLLVSFLVTIVPGLEAGGRAAPPLELEACHGKAKPAEEGIADDSGLRLRQPSPEDVFWAEAFRKPGDGGGADVAGPLTMIQTEYSDPLNGNVVLLLWEETAPNPAGVDVSVDGALLGTVQNPGIAFVTGIPGGDRDFRVEEAGGSGPTYAEGSLRVLDSPPFSSVTNLRCLGTVSEASGCGVMIGWDNETPLPSFYMILVDDALVERTEDSRIKSATLHDVVPGLHQLTVIGFLEATAGNPAALYRGEFVTTDCSVAPCEGNRFIRGVCDGNGDFPRITSAIFSLNFLFLGGLRPSCMAACDANADGGFGITDPIYILNFLFLGGSAPVGWQDTNANGSADPTCTSAPRELCESPNAACR